MKKIYLAIISIGIILTFNSCEEAAEILAAGSGSACDYQHGGGELSETAVANGLTCALLKGTDSATARLSSVDGFLLDQAVKLILPPEVDKLVTDLRGVKVLGQNIGETAYQNLLKGTHDNLITSLNRSAEDAAKSAAPIFVNAITEISITDAFNILKGEDTAATNFLRVKTFDPLTDAFSPIINSSLDKPLINVAGTSVSTNSLYDDFVNSYNSAANTVNNNPLVPSSLQVKTIQTTSIADYAVGKALNGLFLKVSDEEKNIRKNPLNRVTDILKDVFGSLDNE